MNAPSPAWTCNLCGVQIEYPKRACAACRLKTARAVAQLTPEQRAPGDAVERHLRRTGRLP